MRFGDWSKILADVLHFAGEKNFLGNIQALYNEVDVETPEWEAFLTEAHRHFSGEFTIAKLCAAITGAALNGSAMAEMIPSKLGEPLDGNGNLRPGFKVKLGKAFAARNGTKFGDSGIGLQRLSHSTNAVAQWEIVKNQTKTRD